jgi:hypothetical protein
MACATQVERSEVLAEHWWLSSRERHVTRRKEVEQPCPVVHPVLPRRVQLDPVKRALLTLVARGMGSRHRIGIHSRNDTRQMAGGVGETGHDPEPRADLRVEIDRREARVVARLVGRVIAQLRSGCRGDLVVGVGPLCSANTAVSTPVNGTYSRQFDVNKDGECVLTSNSK